MAKKIAILDVQAADMRDLLNLLPPSVVLEGNSLPCSPRSLRLLLDVSATDLKGGRWTYDLIRDDGFIRSLWCGPSEGPGLTTMSMPSAWAILTEGGTLRLWSSDPDGRVSRAKAAELGTVATPLFETPCPHPIMSITEAMIERARVALHDLRYDRLKRMMAGDKRAMGEREEGDPPAMHEDAIVALRAALQPGEGR